MCRSMVKAESESDVCKLCCTAQERSVDLQMALPCLVAVPDAAESPKK